MNKTKTIAVTAGLALVLSVVALVVGLTRGQSTPVSTPDQSADQSVVGGTSSIGGGTYTTTENFTKGLAMGGQEVNLNFAGNIPIGQNFVDIVNKGIGKTIYIDYADAVFSGYATSSFQVYAYATSTAFVASTTNPFYFAVAPAQNASTTMAINGVWVGTDTPPYAISSTNGSNGTSTVAIPDGGHFIFLLHNPFPNNCPVASCDLATSSTRGFSIHYYITTHYNQTF